VKYRVINYGVILPCIDRDFGYNEAKETLSRVVKENPKALEVVSEIAGVLIRRKILQVVEWYTWSNGRIVKISELADMSEEERAKALKSFRKIKCLDMYEERDDDGRKRQRSEEKYRERRIYAVQYVKLVTEMKLSKVLLKILPKTLAEKAVQIFKIED